MTDNHSRRGGRRKGAGAPRGNKNALKTGQRSKDPRVRAFIQSLSQEQLDLVAGSPRDAWLAAVEKAGQDEHDDEDDSVITPFRKHPSIHTAPHPVGPQSKEKEEKRTLGRVVEKLREIRLLGADGFVRSHWPVVLIIERLLDEMDQIRDLAPEEMANVLSPAGLFKAAFHDEVKRETDQFFFCPYCTWNKERRPGQREEALG